jgi:2,4'-dihydroxyacetophenone dioxygenase
MAVENLIPFRGSQPEAMIADLVIPEAWAGDAADWVPLGEGIWSRPLLFNASLGGYAHILRVTQAGVIQRHRHSGAVLAYVLKGRWHYLEHDWVAEEGSFIMEPPGETHTLVVPEGCDEMVTLFSVTGALVYVDPEGEATGYDDVFTRLERTRAHYEAVGLGAGYADRFVR